MKKIYYQLLVLLRLKKPFKTYMGKPVTEFRHNFNVFLSEYIQILNKSSKMSYSRRYFVQKEFEAWLEENQISIPVFKNKILG